VLDGGGGGGAETADACGALAEQVQEAFRVTGSTGVDQVFGDEQGQRGVVGGGPWFPIGPSVDGFDLLGGGAGGSLR
jgi:hypothetical protein